jgi:hypothetical protein
MTRKAKQPRLLPATPPIREDDALSFSDLSTRYRCRCGNTAETGIKLESVVCVKCGAQMRPVA